MSECAWISGSCPISLLLAIALEFDSGHIFWLFLISYFLCSAASNPIPEKNATFIYVYSTELLEAVTKKKTEPRQIAIFFFSKPEKHKYITFLQSKDILFFIDDKNNVLTPL